MGPFPRLGSPGRAQRDSVAWLGQSNLGHVDRSGCVIQVERVRKLSHVQVGSPEKLKKPRLGPVTHKSTAYPDLANSARNETNEPFRRLAEAENIPDILTRPSASPWNGSDKDGMVRTQRLLGG